MAECIRLTLLVHFIVRFKFLQATEPAGNVCFHFCFSALPGRSLASPACDVVSYYQLLLLGFFLLRSGSSCDILPSRGHQCPLAQAGLTTVLNLELALFFMTLTCPNQMLLIILAGFLQVLRGWFGAFSYYDIVVQVWAAWLLGWARTAWFLAWPCTLMGLRPWLFELCTACLLLYL